MPKVSKDGASETIALDGLDVKLEHLEGGYSVCFESHTADGDLADLFRGLPGDRCQLPRWGYVIEGKVAFRLPHGEETTWPATPTTSRRATRPCTTRARRSSSSARPTRSRRRSRSCSQNLDARPGMNYGLAYAVGFHPWEDLAEHPPFAGKLLELVAREEAGPSRPTARRSTSAPAARCGACGSRSEAGR